MKEAFLNHTMNFIASNQKNLGRRRKRKISLWFRGVIYEYYQAYNYLYNGITSRVY